METETKLNITIVLSIILFLLFVTFLVVAIVYIRKYKVAEKITLENKTTIEELQKAITANTSAGTELEKCIVDKKVVEDNFGKCTTNLAACTKPVAPSTK